MPSSLNLRKRFPMIPPRFSLPCLLAFTLLLDTACTKEMRQRHTLASAKSDFEAERYDQAEAACKKALLLSPNDPVAIRQLGLIDFAEGRMLQSYILLQKSAVAEPKNADLQIKLATTEIAIGKRAAAREGAKKVLELDPTNEDAILLLVQTSSNPHDIEESRQIIQKLQQAGKDLAAYRVGLGTLHLLEHDQPAAEADFKSALDLDPKSGAAYLEWGNLSLIRGDIKNAGIEFKKAADLAPPRSSRRMRYIEFEAQNGALDAAKKGLDEMNLQTPDYFPPWIFGMKLAYQERRFDDASVIAGKILLRDPVNYDALLESGLLKTNKGDTAGAIKDLKLADRVYNHTPDVMYALAVAYVKMGDTANAESCLNEALVLAPNFDEASLRLADLDIGKGNLNGAVSRLSALVKLHPKNVRAYLLLARAYQAEKKPDQALAVYNQAVAEFPKDPLVPYSMGVLLNQNGHASEARQAFEKSLALSPTYAPALEMLVSEDVAARQYGPAEERITALIAKYPAYTLPLILRAKLHLVRRETGAAETDLQQAINVDPQSQDAYLLLARVYMASDKPQEAVDKLSALADKTNSVPALMQLGLIHSQLKQFDAARLAYERLLKIDPKFTLALNNLAYLYAENLGQLDKAEGFAARAFAVAPDDATTEDTVGWIKFRRGEYRNALTLLQTAAESKPADPEIQYHLGMAYYMAGQEEPALLALRQAVVSASEFAGKDQARQQLAMLAIDPATATPAGKAALEEWVHSHPQDPIAVRRLAALQARNGSDASVAASFEASLKLNPLDTATMLKLAALYAGPLKKPARARELAKAAHELAPTDAAISQNLGQLLYLTGDYAWSLTLLQEAARDNPGQPDMMYALARGFYSVGNVSQAESTLQDLLGNSATFAGRADAERLASLIKAAKNPAEAKAALPAASKALETDPTYIPALMVTATAREQEGNFQGAADIYEKIIAQDALFAPASRQVALLYLLKLHNDQKAYDAAMKARGVLPDDPDVTKTIGIVAYRRGDFTTAVSSLARSLGRRADDADAVFYSGMSHFKLKERSNAKTDLDHALELDPSGPNAAEAKRTLVQISAAIKAESQDSTATESAN
jgi:tetratricopeptide (TPR) repeat protein